MWTLRVLRFVDGRDSFPRKHVLKADDADTQRRKMMCLLGVDVRDAPSPQVGSEDENPFR